MTIVSAGFAGLAQVAYGELAILALIAFIGSVVFGITGFGAALITIPLATHVVPLPFALGLFVLMDLANSMRIGFENPKLALRAEWIRMVPMIIAGTVAGVTLLVSLPRKMATLALGVFVIAFALYALFRHPDSRARLGTGWAWVAGFAGGVTSTVFGAGGPPYAMYLSHRGLTKEQYRATLGFATLTSISLRTIAFLATGILLDPRVWLYAAAVVPAGLLGLWAAGHIFRRISREALMRAVAMMLLASGASLVLRSLA
ncbi:MAG: sulfite exporter TauE/SafE family protein [Betaproteobacteria bacterium]|nr:sulfite exporter TauE/SafE family protein [Betaproteobacteria bacterium]